MHRLYQMAREGRLLFPAINVNDSVTKSKFDNLYGCRESLVDGIKRATDVMVAGKIAVVCGYGDVGKGSAQSLRALSARGHGHRDRPDLRAAGGDGRLPVMTMDDAAARPTSSSPRPATATSSPHEHMAKMKDEAIVCNIGHFDSEIQVAGSRSTSGSEHQAAGRPGHLPGRQAHHRCWPNGRLVNLGCAHRPPELRDVASFTNQTLAQIELFTNTKAYPIGVYVLPKHLDEKVARLHLEKLGVKLTELTTTQADYLGVPGAGPTRPSTTVIDWRDAMTALERAGVRPSLNARCAG